MAAPTDLIDFDIIENQKENIQALPSGRSAKSLAQLYSPIAGITSPAQTQDVNASIRQAYELEINQIDESDDPLDIYDRYVRWTLNAYPSTSATSQSQLLPLLERATKAFLKSDHYKNDPRYLKIWLQYIRLFSDAPRETFSFLARNKVGEGLALFYEEFAAWLEGAGRWNQAEEIYKLGIERGARPAERLARKFGEFEKRAVNKPAGVQEPSSPALPIVRPALAAKLDPFSVTGPSPVDPQAASRSAQAPSKKQKLQIFSDDGQEARPSSGEGPKGWDNIGTLADRRKENTRAPQPWTGETLNTGSQQNTGMPKMAIFKDKSRSQAQSMANFSPNHPARSRQIVNERTGKVECVFVNLEAVYPNPDDPSEEYCLEELRARARGWLQRDWRREREPTQWKPSHRALDRGVADVTTTLIPLATGDDEQEQLPGRLHRVLNLNDENDPAAASAGADVDAARRFRREERANRTRKIKVREVKGETQTIQTNLDSPRGPKLKRKKVTEPTMTLQTKAATDEIYEMFNQTLTLSEEAEEEEESESESDDDDYISAGESTGTGRISGATSEYGEETQADLTETADPTDNAGDAADDAREDTTWSEFTTSKHMPKKDEEGDDETRTNDTVGSEREPGTSEKFEPTEHHQQQDDQEHLEDEVVTPISPTRQPSNSETFYIPIPPEGYVAPTRPYRDAAQIAANRLPFMTPIVEKTESSLGTATTRKDKDYFNSKTPCPKADLESPFIADTTTELLSSPFQDRLKEALQDESIPQPVLEKASIKPAVSRVLPRQEGRKETTKKGPIIQDAQCNPMDASVHSTILSEVQPPLASFEGYFEHQETIYGRRAEIKRFSKAASNARNGKSLGEKPLSAPGQPPILRFDGAERGYAIKRELGAGAYAPVYLVENSDSSPVGMDEDEDAAATMGNGKFGLARRCLEAIKMEDPPSAWEFYILRIAHRRLGVSRAAESVVQAYEMHLFKDEGYLVEEYQDQGTLLDLVNAISDQNRASGGHNGLDEMMAMFFTVELLRTVEALHAKGIIHGDLKADNVLVRLSRSSSSADDDSFGVPYSRDGTSGWSAKGILLIDFGRGIDMRAFNPNVQFIADWPTSATDCAEMRELRPWTFQADYHGLAAIAHTMLFGKYIDTVVDKNASADIVAGAAKSYRLKEGLKRYWQTDIWNGFFALMLNPGRHLEAEEGQRLPCTRGVKAIREQMESWLESNAEKGVGLKAMLRRADKLVGSRKKT